jgi:hypothetical protein
MAEQSWLGRLWRAIEREYERRIRRASEVIDYSTQSHIHEASGTTDEVAVEEAEVEIVNVPRGTRLPRANSDIEVAE